MARNSREWKDYVENALIRMYELGIRMSHPTPDERVVISCHWYLRNDRSDAINGHDILGDVLKRGLNIDDKHFLIRDSWSEVDEKNPRVEITLTKEKKP